jgi:hypothetical protein
VKNHTDATDTGHPTLKRSGAERELRCPRCGQDIVLDPGATEDAADNAARLHNSELHTPGTRPDWSDVAQWAAKQNAGGAQ